jgi:hypothetical protein
VHSDHWGGSKHSCQEEATISVEGEETEGKPIDTIKEEEERENTMMYSPTEGEEHSTKLLKSFTQEAKQEMTATLKPTTEGEIDNMDFTKLYEELEALKIRLIVKRKHIQ